MSLSNSLYSYLPISLQNAALSVYGAYLGGVRYGRPFSIAVDELVGLEGASCDQIANFQNRRLRQLIKDAVVDVPYYKGRYGYLVDKISDISTENFADYFPVLEKSVVRGQSEQFVSNKDYGSRLSINTSGSTGSPLNVVTTKASVSRNYAFFERFLNSHGVSYKDRSATFAGRLIVPQQQKGPPYWRHNAAQNTWLMSSYHLSDETCGAYVDFLSNLGPAFIDSYPSAISTLARYINQKKISHKIRPRVVVTSSESLTDSAREEIRQAFFCDVADQYGSAEMAGFIGQCKKGRYHANALYGLVEVVDDEGMVLPAGAPGNLVLTGFINPSMPLLRYSIGDSAIISADICDCGSSHPVIKELLGRTDDLIILPDGRKIGRLDPLFKGLSGIAEAQIIQSSVSEINVNVVYSPDCGSSKGDVGRRLEDAIRTRLNADVRIEVKEVPAIEKGPNGKFKSVISLVKR